MTLKSIWNRKVVLTPDRRNIHISHTPNKSLQKKVYSEHEALLLQDCWVCEKTFFLERINFSLEIKARPQLGGDWKLWFWKIPRYERKCRSRYIKSFFGCAFWSWCKILGTAITFTTHPLRPTEGVLGLWKTKKSVASNFSSLFWRWLELRNERPSCWSGFCGEGFLKKTFFATNLVAISGTIWFLCGRVCYIWNAFRFRPHASVVKQVEIRVSLWAGCTYLIKKLRC